jgi:hypothetical protein
LCWFGAESAAQRDGFRQEFGNGISSAGIRKQRGHLQISIAKGWSRGMLRFALLMAAATGALAAGIPPRTSTAGAGDAPRTRSIEWASIVTATACTTACIAAAFFCKKRFELPMHVFGDDFRRGSKALDSPS